MNGLISSLMLSNTSVVGGLSSQKSNNSTRQLDDAFSGILQERMNANQTARSGRTQDYNPLKAADTEMTSETKRNDKPVIKNQTVSRSQPAAASKSETAADKVSRRDEDAGEAPRQTKSDDENLAAIDLVSLLLERLFAKLEQLSEGTQAQTDAQTGDKIENMVDALKKGLMGNIEDLEKLLDSILAGKTDPTTQELVGDFKALLEQVKAMVETVTETAAAATGAQPNLEIDIQVGRGEEYKALLMKLKSESKDILEKLKVKLTDMSKIPAGEVQTEEGILEGTDLAAEPESKSSGDEGSFEQKPDRTQVRERHGKTGEGQPVREMAVETNAADEIQPEETIPAADVRTDAPVEVKAVKAEFQLSPKAQAQSVTHQVMLKVKLMAGENKQEMEMHLKPESLGKLSLKIIHERGEILAKITAENEQVKSILESNMQLLKDALEKSGYSVQNLSVSVGNGNKENQGQNQNQNTSDRNGRFASGRISAMDGKIEGAAIRPGYYQGMQGASRIDLTA